MKILKIILPIALAFCFTGCLDVDEQIDVKKDGSGQMTEDMDMSQMIDILQTYMGKDEMSKKGLQNMDTTIYLKDIVDTISSFSAEKKALLRPASVHIKLDMDGKVFKTRMVFPFTSQENLQKLYAVMSDGSSLGNAKLFGNLGGDEGGNGGNGQSPDLSQFTNIYDFKCKDGLMSKRVNKEKWKALADNPQVAQMKQASQMGMDINYTTTILLPRPVKKIDNPNAKLSDDKKAVTMKYNFSDALDHPEQFEYTIEY
ncbi:hypothetical protein [Puia dinghuensis]|uniref:Uncharacterized protein n=1 Tax=Puia dinghuensis TaxID=1792502 RepID=A0A8J2XU28_9BACT|nr:hypothetical protein [Puia dinghuensis]GGB08859.1 hypothetical protein GCM10011511_35450 [Puia dinghuensis]